MKWWIFGVKMTDFNNDPIGRFAHDLPRSEIISRAIVSVSPRKTKDGGRNLKTTAGEECYDWFTDGMKWALGDLVLYCAELEESETMPFDDSHEFEKEVEDNTLLISVTKITRWVWMVDVMWNKPPVRVVDDPAVRAVVADDSDSDDPSC